MLILVEKISPAFLIITLLMLMIATVSFPVKADLWSAPMQLTFNIGGSWPSISGDGSKIAFNVVVDQNHTVFVVNSDGSGLRQLTGNSSYCEFPSISDDGGKIAFASAFWNSSYRNNPSFEICVANSDGSGLKQLTNSRDNRDPSISGDGSKVSFQSDGEVFVINSDGSGERQLTFSDYATFIHRAPTTSDDGGKIAFHSDAMFADVPSKEISVANSDGSGTKQLTFKMSAVSPSISDDGSKIAFYGEVNGYYEVFVVNSDGTGLKQLTFNTTGHTSPFSPSISGDGNRITFCSDVNDEFWDVYVINSDGTGLTQLTNDTMSGYAPSISDDGSKIAFYGDMDHDDSEIFVVSLDADAGVSPEPTPRIEPFSTTLVAIASGASVAIVSVGLLVYFKKRKRSRSIEA